MHVKQTSSISFYLLLPSSIFYYLPLPLPFVKKFQK